jgi:hypothetical protein
MHGPSHAKSAKVAKDCNEENGVSFTHVVAGPLGDLGVLCVMHGPSHAKSAKDAKDSTRTAGSELRYCPALLGDLGALRVMHGPSHAKSAKGAKDCNEENGVSFTHVVAGPLGDLGALCVMRSQGISRQERKVRKGLQWEEPGFWI